MDLLCAEFEIAGDGELFDGLAAGALSGGVEAADAFNFVVEEIDAVGAIGVVGVNVYEAATSGDLAWVFAESF